MPRTILRPTQAIIRRAPHATLTARMLVLFAVALTVTSCASNRSVAEFQVYRTSFTSTSAAGTAILDRLAVAERKIFVTDAGIPDEAFPPDREEQIEFRPDEATYFTNAVDPPGTAAFRRALLAITNYNETLFGLASGQTAEALAGNISRIATAGAGVVGEAASVAGVGAGAAGGALASTAAVGTINAALTALNPLIKAALNAQTREEFRKHLLAEAHTIEKLILITRNGTSEVFVTLVRPILDEASDKNDGLLTEDQKKEIRGIRELLSNWVIMLDGTLVALKAGVAAAGQADSAFSIFGLVFSATELEATARATRSNLATLGQ